MACGRVGASPTAESSGLAEIRFWGGPAFKGRFGSKDIRGYHGFMCFVFLSFGGGGGVVILAGV